MKLSREVRHTPYGHSGFDLEGESSCELSNKVDFDKSQCVSLRYLPHREILWAYRLALVSRAHHKDVCNQTDLPRDGVWVGGFPGCCNLGLLDFTITSQSRPRLHDRAISATDALAKV